MFVCDVRFDDAISELELLFSVVDDISNVDRLPARHHNLEVLPLQTSEARTHAAS